MWCCILRSQAFGYASRWQQYYQYQIILLHPSFPRFWLCKRAHALDSWYRYSCTLRFHSFGYASLIIVLWFAQILPLHPSFRRHGKRLVASFVSRFSGVQVQNPQDELHPSFHGFEMSKPPLYLHIASLFPVASVVPRVLLMQDLKKEIYTMRFLLLHPSFAGLWLCKNCKRKPRVTSRIDCILRSQVLLM